MFLACTRQTKPIMPPKTEDPLTPQEVSLIKLWIEEGAKAPTTMRVKEKIIVNLPPALVKPVRAVAVSPDGKYVAASRGNQIHIFDGKKGDFIKTLIDPALKTPDGKEAKAAHISLVESHDLLARRQNARLRKLPGTDPLGHGEIAADQTRHRFRGPRYLHRLLARRQVLRHRRRSGHRGWRDQDLRCSGQAGDGDQERTQRHGASP